MDKTKKQREIIIKLCVMIIYLIINGILLAGHEHWRDEANVWLVARELTPIELIHEIHWQGHPCLWYFIIMPFAKLGLPFQTISIISYLVMAVVSGLLLFRAPFHMLTKVICLFSPIFTYYYPVVARNYCVLVLLLLLLAHLYPKRNEKCLLYGLLLGLLVQADTLGMVIAGLISCMWLWECIGSGVREKSIKLFLKMVKGLWLPLVSFCFWMYQFHGVNESPLYQNRDFSLSEMIREMGFFSKYILNRVTGQGEIFNFFLVLLFLGAGVLITIRIKNAWPIIVVIGLFTFQVIFSLLIYQLHIWHYITLCFTVIWCFWVGYDKRNKVIKEYPKNTINKLGAFGNILGELLLCVLGITMLFMWISPEEPSNLNNALNGLYSDGINTAQYIKDNIEEKELIVSTDVSEAASVVAYLNRDYRIYFAGNGEAETFSSYREDQNAPITYEELLAWVKENFPEEEQFYLMICKTNCLTDVSDEEKQNWEKCYQTPEETARGEEYSLFRVSLK